MPLLVAMIGGIAVMAGGIVIILLGIRLGGSGDRAAAAATMTTMTASDSGAVVAGTGAAVTDGGLQFVVQAITCGSRRVGTAASGKAAQGQYCTVTLAVRNVGPRTRAFDPAVQRALAVDGTVYRADGEAGLYANGTGALTGSLGPGARTSGVVLFDIPLGSALVELELHDTDFSAGAHVRVS